MEEVSKSARMTPMIVCERRPAAAAAAAAPLYQSDTEGSAAHSPCLHCVFPKPNRGRELMEGTGVAQCEVRGPAGDG